MGKLEGRRSFGRPRRRLEDNIKMDLQEVGCGGVDLIQLAQDRDRRWALVNVVMNLRVSKMLGITCLAANRLASQEGLCCVGKEVSIDLYIVSNVLKKPAAYIFR